MVTQFVNQMAKCHPIFKNSIIENDIVVKITKEALKARQASPMIGFFLPVLF
jgi:hypothetical protein